MYQISEFSKIFQVSVKTLRHYDKLGLLKPAEVDRETGYRYYDRSQLDRMLLIQKLKRYGFSLEEISALTCCADDAAFCQSLRRQQKRLEWRQQELGMILQELTLHLQQLERTDDTMQQVENRYRIQLMETPKIPALSCRNRMSVDDFGKYYGTLYERIAKEHYTPNGVFGAMYHDKEWNRESTDIELFIGIQEAAKADRTLEPRLCAATTHKGSYSTLPEAYAALVAWIEENGYVWNGAPYDVYTKTARDGIPASEWETEIYFPVRKK